MMRLLREKWLLILAVLAVGGILFVTLYNPYTGPDVIGDPVQIMLSQPERIDFAGTDGTVALFCLASYDMTAAVKSVHRYTTDYAAKVSPMDLVLAWGSLNQAEVDTRISYRQSGRWYYYQYQADCPVDGAYIQAHSANVHLIPADENVRRQLDSLRKNDTIHLTGFLVAVQFETGEWRSSLSRDDSGDGACEIIYVTAID